MKPNLETLPIDTKLISQNTVVGSKDYVAQEVISGKDYDFKCDIYSLGLTIFYLMDFKLPFFSCITSEGVFVRNPINGVYLNNFYSSELRNLVYKMISENPNNRPTARELKEILAKMEEPIIKPNNYNQCDLSSIISVITFICEIDELKFGELKSLIFSRYNNNINFLKFFLPINVIGLKEIIGYDKNNIINKNKFDEYFYMLKYSLSTKSNIQNLMENNDPITILQVLIHYFSKEYKEHMPCSNEIFKIPNFIINQNIPESMKQKIFETIKQDFELNYAGPFVDLFYFITTIIKRCKFCKNIFNNFNTICFSI